MCEIHSQYNVYILRQISCEDFEQLTSLECSQDDVKFFAVCNHPKNCKF